MKHFETYRIIFFTVLVLLVDSGAGDSDSLKIKLL